jgi:methylenetetrahydrofolate reductase (NADPH)
VDDVFKLGADLPIVPGIMPITNFSQLARFSDACGAEIPRWIRQRLAGYGDDVASITAFGREVITDLCDQLLTAGVPGLHFYTMNRADPTLSILRNLKLLDS